MTVTSVAFNNDKKTPLVISTSFDGTINVWHVETGRLEQTLDPGVDDRVNCAIFSPDNRTIYAGIGTGQIKIWDYSDTNYDVRNFLMSVNRMNATRVKNMNTKKERVKRARSLPLSLPRSTRKLTSRSAPTIMKVSKSPDKKKYKTKSVELDAELYVDTLNEDIDKVVASYLKIPKNKKKYKTITNISPD
jgi:WD40 repeat protein